ncbi:MAG TPA: MerR family transcriptional regulator [Thiobacillaceae bacterium]|nr:MerR family transcriptional regulator [Thiobacillaceae bacterium]
MDTISLKKIGEVADLLGTTPRALRFYEEEGLVIARRSSGGTRLYSKEDIARFRAILRLAHTGVPLSLIKELATTREKFTSGAKASRSVHSVLETLQEKTQEQIKALAKLEADLTTAAKTIEDCFHCGNPPTRKGCPDCPVNNYLESSEILNLVWEQNLEQTKA